MEDAHIACLDLVTHTSLGQVYNASRVGRDGINQKDIALFGVFDGHGGDFRVPLVLPMSRLFHVTLIFSQRYINTNYSNS